MNETTEKKKNVRLQIKHVRLSFPHLDAPYASPMYPEQAPKYSATFLLEPGSAEHRQIAAAIQEVARAAWGEKYAAALANPTSDKQPLHRGDDKTKVYDGYAGMMYVGASSRQAPELRDADGKRRITGDAEIRERFMPGYYVNAIIEFWPELRYSRRVCCQLVGVQFAGYADILGGGAAQGCDFPDCSADVAASGMPMEDIPF